VKLSTPSKEQTAELEPFVGLTLAQIIVPQTEAQYASAVNDILAAAVVGFDTESKPTFTKGEVSQGPHIVQFALPTKAYIFQVSNTHAHSFCVTLLESQALLKVGFGLESDKAQIQNKFNIKMNSLRDLNVDFKAKGFERTTGVRAAVAIVMNQKFHKSKRVTTSNWANAALTEQQLLYAANDAYAALMVYQQLTASIYLPFATTNVQ
jgi:ribonuclease D